ncbi:MAG: Gfo/Idh/MocA family protein [Acidimicrobiia bacterium]
MTTSTLGVGIVGLSASGGWASVAHVPALAAVDGFELRGLATSSAETARAAADLYGVPLAFGSVEELAARDEIDLVVVSVKVPRHRELVLPALAAGKPVLCEWPLGNGLAEAVELADAAAGVGGFVGLQGRALPVVRHVRDLVAGGYVGEVLSTSLLATSSVWGTPVPPKRAYLLDRANGASMLTIPFGHLLDSIASALGPLVELSATTATRRPEVPEEGTGRTVPVTVEDQIAVTGVLAGGAVASFHLRGVASRATSLLWEIQGTEGEIQVTGAGGSLNAGGIVVRGAQGGAELAELPVPAGLDDHPELADQPGHGVAHTYDRIRRDLAEGTREAPDFAHAVDHHRVLDHLRRSAADGTRHRTTD